MPGWRSQVILSEGKGKGEIQVGVKAMEEVVGSAKAKETSAHLSLGFHLGGDHLGSNFSAHLGSNPGWLWMCHTAAAASGMI